MMQEYIYEALFQEFINCINKKVMVWRAKYFKKTRENSGDKF